MINSIPFKHNRPTEMDELSSPAGTPEHAPEPDVISCGSDELVALKMKANKARKELEDLREQISAAHAALYKTKEYNEISRLQSLALEKLSISSKAEGQYEAFRDWLNGGDPVGDWYGGRNE